MTCKKLQVTGFPSKAPGHSDVVNPRISCAVGKNETPLPGVQNFSQKQPKKRQSYRNDQQEEIDAYHRCKAPETGIKTNCRAIPWYVPFRADIPPRPRPSIQSPARATSGRRCLNLGHPFEADPIQRANPEGRVLSGVNEVTTNKSVTYILHREFHTKHARTICCH